MNLNWSADVPFGDENSMLDFLGAHEIAHQTIASRVSVNGITIRSIPLSDAPQVTSDWLLDHYALHQQIADVLQQPVIPDLSVVDMKDEEQFRDWMQLHARLHEQINLAAGIYT